MMVDSFEHGNWCHYSQKTCLFKISWKVCKIKGKKRKLMYYYLITTVIIEYA